MSRKEMGSSSWIWLLGVLVLSAAAAGSYLLFRSEPGAGLTVHVVVVTADGKPAVGASVRAKNGGPSVTLDAKGRARLTNVVPAAVELPLSERVAAAIQLQARFFAERTSKRDVEPIGDGDWDVRIVVEANGVLTLRLEATTLSRPVAYLESDDHVVAMAGRGVARLNQNATYRVFPSASNQVTLTVKGDTGIAMERTALVSPGPGFVRQVDIRVSRARPITGRVIPAEAIEVPSLAGRMRVIPTPAGRGDITPKPAVANAYVELDPVRIEPDGSFLVPHVRRGTYELIAELDFLGRADPRLADGGEDVDVIADIRAGWARLVFPKDLPADPHDLEYHAMSLADDGAVAAEGVGVLHLGAATYIVMHELSPFEMVIHLPGSAEHAPMRAQFRMKGDESAVEQTLVFAPIPHGTLVVNVPDTIRHAMRGGTLTVEVDGRRRVQSLLRGLTKQVVMKHVEAGPTLLRVDWEDPTMTPWVTSVEVLADDDVHAVAERQPK